jgi:hypothetical protein
VVREELAAGGVERPARAAIENASIRNFVKS